jgi:uncharacterized protein (UPF0335 family)
MKKLLDFFIKVEDDKPAQETKTPAPTVVSSISSIGQEDSEIKKQLVDALEKANMEGYDYFEFARAVDSQANIVPSEELRYKTSFAMASSMGVTTDKLVSSADFYLSILKKKEDEFNTAMEQHSNSAIVSKEASIKKYDADMLSLSDQIKKITEQINALQQQKTAMSNDISSAKSEIEKVKNNFYATLKIFTGRITTDVEKIKAYLIGVK